MTGRDPLETLGKAWRDGDQAEALPWVPPEYLERRARRLAKQVAWRNAREWVAAAVVVVLFAAGALTTDRWLTRVGCVWTVISALWVAWVLMRRGGNLPQPSVDAPTDEFLQYERSQLERQAVLLERVPTWYVLPLAVGTGLILADHVRILIERGAPPVAFVAVAVVFVIVLVVYLGVLVWNRRAARTLRQRLAMLRPEPL